MAKPNVENKNKPYTEEYKKKCKVAWYAGGRPDSMTQLQELIPVDEYGRKPYRTALDAWRDEDGWDIWADELDVKSELEIDDFLVAQRVKMLKEQGSNAQELRKKAITYLRDKGFDSSASAVNAFVQSVKIERSSRGISEKIEKLLMMDDEDLTKEAMKLLGQVKESGETIDIEAEDIEDDEETNS